jgi:hypothetical protein
MNSIEFAVKDGVPYAIDFMNPAPDFDINSLTQEYFDWVVQHMADLVIRLATSGRRQGRTSKAVHWQDLFKGQAGGGPGTRRTSGRARSDISSA